ncbi:MAG: sigma-70 family RNA polymerase sigma factor [Acidobacteria bacterium]|nr:sigma-70 family RNA polymerase sigma factor [Acidobacteriota bacterium]
MIDHQIQDNEQPLKKDALAHLWRWLSSDKEQAGLRYETLRRKLVELFARRQVPALFLYELADETLDRVGRKLAEGEVIHNPEPMAYVYGVARNVLSEFWRNHTRREKEETTFENLSPRDLARIESRQKLQEERQEKERWLECMDEFLKTLPPQDALLLKNCHHDDQYQQSINRRQAAAQMGMAESSLRTHLHRIRQMLQRKVRACVERRQK